MHDQVCSEILRELTVTIKNLADILDISFEGMMAIITLTHEEINIEQQLKKPSLN